jgi:RHS repeat-associated protein
MRRMSSARPLARNASFRALCTALSVCCGGLLCDRALAAEDTGALSTSSLSPRPTTALPGQSVTLLPDGRWMLVGGESEQGPSAVIETSGGAANRPFAASLHYARTGHSATVLPDGRVLVLGGMGPDGRLVEVAEVVNPIDSTISELPAGAIQARTRHTATLLTNGQVLIAGGLDADGNTLSSAQLWDFATGVALPSQSQLLVARYAHEAELLATGEGLLSGGRSGNGEAVSSAEVYNPNTNLFESSSERRDDRVLPRVAAQPAMLADTLPSDGSVDVALSTLIGIRFNRAVQIDQLSTKTIAVIGPGGPVAGSVAGAEGGMLAFFKPEIELLPGTTYTLFIRGVTDSSGLEIPLTTVRFTTMRFNAQPSRSERPASVIPNEPAKAIAPEETKAAIPPARQTRPAPRKTTVTLRTSPEPRPVSPLPEDWIPRAENRHGAWRVLGLAGDPPVSPDVPASPLLNAPAGSAALSGRVLRFNGHAIRGVHVSIGTVATSTDEEGRFVLGGLTPGAQLLRIDGRMASSENRHYTEHYVRVAVEAGKTTTLGDPVYLARVNPSTEVSISSPADKDIVLTHPDIPGLEVRIPKGAVLREPDGKVVRTVSITPIPVDRAPYRTPVPFSVYFTLQPGGAYVDGDPSKAIKITYPNYLGLASGTSVNFWNYNPEGGGWQIYGHGNVSADGKRIIADESVGFRQIMSFGFGINQNNGPPPATAPIPNGTCCGDPVDNATGIFIHNVTDMMLNDVMPISVTRMYRTNDNQTHLFGVGTNLSYGMYLYKPSTSTNAFLVRGDGSQIPFAPAPYGSPPGVTYVNLGSPTEFYGAVLIMNETTQTWDCLLRDGTLYRFTSQDPSPLQAIIDRNGNQITISYQLDNVLATSPPISQVTSPNGRYVQFYYDSFNRITQAIDNAGRQTTYSYDTAGRLQSVTDADGYTESYGYDPVTNNMNLVTDKRGNSMVQNQFDANARVKNQTLADGAFWQFSYALDGNGNVTQTTITDPRNYIRQETYNQSGYATRIVLAQGQPEQQLYTIARTAANLPQLVTDPLSRQTLYGYDGFGDLTSLTQLYTTAGAVTYTMSYDPTFHQLTAVTDPLGHTASAKVDSHGNTTAVSDALGDTTSIAYGQQGLPISVTDALSHATQFGFVGADLATVTDALNRQMQFTSDAVGRRRTITDPLGNSARLSYDAMDRLQSVTDPLGNITSLAYDHNGNLLSSTDPKNVVQIFTYDTRNRRHTYLDPAGKTATYTFDGMSNLTSILDRKNQTTGVTYDGINRPTQVTYQDGSTIAITWDGGNRATKFVDSINGTINRTFDLLDRLQQETSPQGTVSYQYDAAGRRQTMTATGQAVVNYTFDNANRLTQVAQGTTTLGFGYDSASRRTTVTLPNAIVGTYVFDNANQLTGITYKHGATQVGTLTYGYDSGGRRTSAGGTLAGFVPPAYVAALSYDGTNRLTSSGGTSLGYDADGNLTSLGSTTYTWNARNQLTATSGGNASFSYDAVGRRVSATVSGSTTPYLYDGLNPATMSGSLLLASGNLDEVYALVTSSATTSFLRDGVNSSVALTSSSATISANYYYSPYGDSARTGSSSTPLEFTGRENDGTTGLYYYRARYYSPQLGRFISEDPLGLVAGTNFYAYVGGNPISQSDPTGRLGLPGAGIAIALDLGKQIFIQHRSLRCVNVGEVVMAGVIGFILPGFTNFADAALGYEEFLPTAYQGVGFPAIAFAFGAGAAVKATARHLEGSSCGCE